MTIKQHGGVFGRNPTFNDVEIEGDLSVDGTLTIGGNVITGLDYEGGWNASTNTPDLTAATPAAGKFWIVSVAGSTNLGGITNWSQGDWALYDGSAWQRVEGGTVDLTNGVTGILPIANGGTNASTASTARTNLGSGAVGDNLFTAATALAAQQAMDTEVGTDVQAYDAGLQSISGLTTAADKMIYTTASDTYAVTDLTSAGRALLDDADAAAQRTTLGLGTAATTASTDYATAAQGSTADSALQPGDVDDTPVDGATQDPISSNWAYDHAALTTAHGISSFGATLVDDADAATARTTLGLGSIATQAANNVNIDGGAIDGTTIGGSSAGAGTFTNLTSTGTTALQNVSTTNSALNISSSASDGSVTIDSGGRVGIGTASPSVWSSGAYNLVLSAASGSACGITINNDGASDSGAIFFGNGTSENAKGRVRYYHSDDSLVIHTNNDERMRIDSSGNVGIGTSSPAQKLHVSGNGIISNDLLIGQNYGNDFSEITIRGDAGGNASLGSFTWQNYRSGNNYPMGKIDVQRIGADTLGGMLFSTGASGSLTERMRIDQSGNLLIGYTSSNGSYKLQVNSQIFATNATIATSDGNYKENVKPLDGALSLVSQLNPVQFDWKEHPVHEFDRNQSTIGFIAQEVQQVLADQPYLNSIVKANECVLDPEETDKDGNVIKEAVTESFLGIAEGNMVALLTKALQEAVTKIEALESRIAALESN